ncbi:MAG TPA: poly(R)-hydroxyalkanoic acid synthase subunit PhaE [Smithellaceae bacterium]|nr:poly(R)-hydroxyalkanoic acid synthase subunit PhaE [Smithellaceae bacterium]
MAQDGNPFPNKESILLPWLQTLGEMWLNLAKAVPPNSDTALKTQTVIQNRFTEQLQTNLNLMKSLSLMMSQPESASAAANSVNALPEILLKMAKSGFDAAIQIQNHMIEKAGRIGKRTEAYNFDNLDQEIFRALTDVYEKELRQYLKIPPLGLTRFYQERFNAMLDKHNLFETTLAEFLSILYLPMEKSFKIFQEKLNQMAEEGSLPKDTKESYAMWLKILEGHYMSLFKSKDYTDALHRTLGNLEDFIIARDQALNDILQFLPVVTHKDLDDLYREFYDLKKRVKALEKQMEVSPNTLKTATRP